MQIRTNWYAQTATVISDWWLYSGVKRRTYRVARNVIQLNIYITPPQQMHTDEEIGFKTPGWTTDNVQHTACQGHGVKKASKTSDRGPVSCMTSADDARARVKGRQGVRSWHGAVILENKDNRTYVQRLDRTDEDGRSLRFKVAPHKSLRRVYGLHCGQRISVAFHFFLWPFPTPEAKEYLLTKRVPRHQRLYF